MWPLLKAFGRAQKNLLSNTKTLGLISSEKWYLDSYFHNLAAPYHLLTGIWRFLKEDWFCNGNIWVMKNNKIQLPPGPWELIKFGFIQSHSTLSRRRLKAVQCLQLTTSCQHFVLFSLLGLLSDIRVHGSIQTFPKLVAHTFWWTAVSVNSVDAFSYVRNSGMEPY